MELSKLQDLLRKLNTGSLSEKEAQQLKDWYRQNGETGISRQMLKDWESTSATEDVSERMAWTSFRKRINSSKATRLRSIRSWGAVAASILVLIIGGFLFFDAPTPEKLAVNEISLSDGSVVWLTPNSQITYGNSFDEHSREVNLSGEAFFEVAKDSSRPFIVKTSRIETKVLGTSFNIDASPQNETVRISLIEGKIQVKYSPNDSVVLSPGEELVFHKETLQAAKGTYIGDRPYAWKNGIIHFVKADIHEVTRILKQWYKVNFTIENEQLMQSELVHYVDTKKRTLEEVLDQISRVADYTFEKKSRNEIVVRPKQKK